MAPIVLRHNPSPEDTSWVFSEVLPRIRQQGFGYHVSFKPEQISIDTIRFPQNRILQSDDVSKFVLVSFEGLRFPEQPARVAREYMIRFFKAGLFLNGTQYRFYGHSNSQLVRSLLTTFDYRTNNAQSSDPGVAFYVKQKRMRS